MRPVAGGHGMLPCCCGPCRIIREREDPQETRAMGYACYPVDSVSRCK